MKRLIAVAIEGSWEGDWQTAQGNEVAAIAHPIGDRESVRLEVDTGDQVLVLQLSAVPTLVPRSCLKYRVVKVVKLFPIPGDELSRTTVEMILSNGLAPA